MCVERGEGKNFVCFVSLCVFACLRDLFMPPCLRGLFMSGSYLKHTAYVLVFMIVFVLVLRKQDVTRNLRTRWQNSMPCTRSSGKRRMMVISALLTSTRRKRGRSPHFSTLMFSVNSLSAATDHDDISIISRFRALSKSTHLFLSDAKALSGLCAKREVTIKLLLGSLPKL